MKDDPERARGLITSLSFQARLELMCQVSAKDKLDLVELAEDRIRIVRALPKQELFFAVQELGKEGAIELIARASLEQINFMLDLDCWKRGEIDLDKVREWIKTLRECSPRKLLTWLQKADPELIIYFFKRHIKVVKPDDPSNPDDPAFGGLPREFYFTLDNQYFIEFIGPAEAQELIYQVLDLIFPVDQHLYFTIMEGVIWELNMGLEEEARHWRQARLEDAGFPPLDEATAIYQYINPDTFNPQVHKKSLALSDYAYKDVSVPETTEAIISSRFYLSPIVKDSFFIESLANLQADPIFPLCQQELIVLFNKVLLVEVIDFSRMEEVRRAFELGHHYLNIGLEYICGNDLSKGKEILKEVRWQKIFQLGFSLIRQLQREAKKARSELQRVQPANDPADKAIRREIARALAGLLKKHPQMYQDKTDEIGRPVYLPLESLEELRQAEEKLGTIKKFLSQSVPVP